MRELAGGRAERHRKREDDRRRRQRLRHVDGDHRRDDQVQTEPDQPWTSAPRKAAVASTASAVGSSRAVEEGAQIGENAHGALGVHRLQEVVVALRALDLPHQELH